MKTIDKRILELQRKEFDSSLSKSESVELGRLYITKETIEKYSEEKEVKFIAFEDMRYLNYFLSYCNIISISFDSINHEHIIYYTEK